MDITIQFTDGDIVTVDHSSFYSHVKDKNLFRFSIGNADFYNHDYYALEDKGECVMVSEWNSDHACVYQVYSPDKWVRTQYGHGADPEISTPLVEFKDPDNFVRGLLVADEQAAKLFASWPITKLSDFSREGM